MGGNSSGNGYNAATRTVMLVFDAIKRARHNQTANLTQHPLQTGFNISDHVVKQPTVVNLEVGMSDAIASYALAGYTPMWTGNVSKSVSCYQEMVALMNNRQIVTLNTRLDTYQNMVLINIQVEDTHRTYFGGLAMSLTFQQVFIADVSTSYESARIQASNETQQGTVQPQAPVKAVVDQHKVPFGPVLSVPGTVPGAEVLSDIANWLVQGAKVPGAGAWTSGILNYSFPPPL
jgi:hypothetical protein